MSSLKRRLSEDEAAISLLQNEVNNLKKFKVGDRDIIMREVPARPPGRYSPRMVNGGFPFVAPTTQPRVNVNVQAPRTIVDPKEAERLAYQSGYRIPKPVNVRSTWKQALPVVAPMTPYRVSAYGRKRAASAASLARANTSAKRGGTKIPKKTLQKAGKWADRRLAMRHFMGKTKAFLIKALSSKPKIVLAKCLTNYLNK